MSERLAVTSGESCRILCWFRSFHWRKSPGIAHADVPTTVPCPGPLYRPCITWFPAHGSLIAIAFRDDRSLDRNSKISESFKKNIQLRFGSRWVPVVAAEFRKNRVEIFNF